MSDLETRIAKLEAIEDIKRLKHRHVQLADKGGYPEDDLAQLWTDDCVWRGMTTDVDGETGWDQTPGSGEFRGHDGLREFFALNGGTYDWVLHILACPDISVDDDLVNATGHWHFLMPSIRTIDDERRGAAWLGGFQIDEYRKVGGEWKFHKVSIDIKLMQAHADGWGTNRYFAAPPIS